MLKASGITEAEWKIIKLLWEKSPRTMPELTATLYPETEWTRYTVITLLKRMMAKGTVRMEEARPVRLYYPAIEKSDVAAQQTNTLLSRLFEGKASLMVNSLVEQGALSDGDVDELMGILEQAKGGTRDDSFV